MAGPRTQRWRRGKSVSFLAGSRRFSRKAPSRRIDIRALHFGLLPMDPASDPRGAPSPASKPWFCDHARSDGMEGLVSVQGVKYTTARGGSGASGRLHLEQTRRPREAMPYGHDADLRGDGSISDLTGKFPETVLRHLARNYGAESSRILGYATQRPELARTVAGSKEVLRAELRPRYSGGDGTIPRRSRVSTDGSRDDRTSRAGIPGRLCRNRGSRARMGRSTDFTTVGSCRTVLSGYGDPADPEGRSRKSFGCLTRERSRE